MTKEQHDKACELIKKIKQAEEILRRTTPPTSEQTAVSYFDVKIFSVNGAMLANINTPFEDKELAELVTTTIRDFYTEKLAALETEFANL